MVQADKLLTLKQSYKCFILIFILTLVNEPLSMNKPILLLLLLLYFSLCAGAQKIYFSSVGNRWIRESTFTGGPIIIHKSADSVYKDTVINNNRYGICMGENSGRFLLRDDTTSDKVYERYITDTVDHLKFDYSLKLGDTTLYEGDSCIVTKKDSISINNIWYKSWTFSSIKYTPTTIDIIEGVGVTGLGGFENFSSLVCFSQNGIILYGSSGNCNLSVNDYVYQNNKPILSPNPISPNTKIIFPNIILQGKLKIINSIGQTVFTTPIHNQKEEQIGTFITNPGMYYYILSDEQNGMNYAGQFICN